MCERLSVCGPIFRSKLIWIVIVAYSNLVCNVENEKRIVMADIITELLCIGDSLVVVKLDVSMF